jgi:hypothetical protein
MDIFTGMEGQLTKMKINICENTEPFNPRTGEDYEFVVLVNPEQIKQKYATQFDESQADGATGADVRFRVQKPQKFETDLLFDSTGVIANDQMPLSNILGTKQVEGVDSQLERFKKIVFKYNGENHEPNLLQIQWGSFLFRGKLKDLIITYSLFKPDGTPIRAKAKCTFVESMADALRAARERSESPDLTHVRTLKNDENLPLMSHRIYKDPGYYREVAKANKLRSLRQINIGTQIHFPPINKTSR